MARQVRRIVCFEIDPWLNDHMYIVPGLGDFGDRYFGTETRVAGCASLARCRVVRPQIGDAASQDDAQPESHPHT